MRPGSRTKISIPLVLPQNRHPACPGLPWERSAAPIDRLTQRLWRGAEEPVLSGVEGTPGVLILLRLFGAFNLRARTSWFHHGFSPGPRTRNLPASCYASDDICSRKAPSSIGKVSIAGVLRLRAVSHVLSDRSARRFAQDDDSVVGIKNIGSCDANCALLSTCDSPQVNVAREN